MPRKHLPLLSPAAWLERLDGNQRQVCLLTGNGEGWGTVLAWNPSAQYIYRRGGTSSGIASFIDAQTGQGRRVLGFITYDMGYELHGIAQTAKDNLGLPGMYFLAFDNYLETTRRATVVHYRDQSFLEEATALALGTAPSAPKLPLLDRPFKPVMPKHAYTQAYNKIKRYILDGDAYQVNLTHRLEAHSSASSRRLFAKILKNTSAGFMAYIEGDGFAVLSASPERFVRIEGSHIETLPIKGTRPRGNTPAHDRQLHRELLGSAKDAAELNMITDLMRNDLGKICAAGSVTVAARRQLLTTPAVIHTYSHIRGHLRPGIRPIQAVLSMFPGGSITGCPKKRAMEIIDELEPFTRGVYCGAIVSVDTRGRLDSSIAIRTIMHKNNRLILPVGGGIVHKSDGREEYQETLDKARALVTALTVY